jgi:hypothetical protein
MLNKFQIPWNFMNIQRKEKSAEVSEEYVASIFKVEK